MNDDSFRRSAAGLTIVYSAIFTIVVVEPYLPTAEVHILEPQGAVHDQAGVRAVEVLQASSTGAAGIL